VPTDQNPYRPAPGSQPPLLVGRDPQLSAGRNAIALTQSGGAAQPIIFTGLRGMGKTVLLRRCASEAERQGALVLRGEAGEDLPLAQAVRRSLARAQRELRDVPAKLRDALDVALAAIPEPRFILPNDAGAVSLAPRQRDEPHRPLADALDDLNRAAWAHDRFLVIAIDEIQDTDPRELRPVVTLVHESSGTQTPILLLGAGLPSAPSHLLKARTYTERWRYFELGLLSPQDSAQAIALPAKDRGVTFTAQALESLVDATAGYPFFIQEYAANVWVARSSDTISLDDVRRIVPGVRLSLEQSYYENRIRTVTPRELRYVLALADLGPGVHPVGEVAAALDSTSEELSSIRNQLIRKDVVFAPGAGLLEFRMPLTDRYVISHRDELARRAGLTKPALKPGHYKL
jgi:hypothetical protein